jgi:acyl-CoA thioesterase
VTPFSEIIDSITSDGEAFVPDDWQQGRTTYGGMSAALCVAGALREIPDLPPLRSAQFTFVGPAAGALSIACNVLRAGKNSVFIGVDLHGDSGLATRATLTFAAGRDSMLHYPAREPPAVPQPADCDDFFAGGKGPRFIQHFEVLRAGGHPPLSAAATPDLLVWMRHRDESARGGLLGLIALADALPPAAFTMFAAPAPISTMTWSIEIADPVVATTDVNDGWHLMMSRGEYVANGYTGQDMHLWNGAGVPILVARQTVAIFT